MASSDYVSSGKKQDGAETETHRPGDDRTCRGTPYVLNVFVLVVQSFQRVPALKAMAPTQSEPPFQVAQLVVLALFVVIGVAAVIRFRIGTSGTGDRLHPQTHSAAGAGTR